ncbi:hypothetical protein CCACVL1_08605, partial [Corchorus capsularis]
TQASQQIDDSAEAQKEMWPRGSDDYKYWNWR